MARDTTPTAARVEPHEATRAPTAHPLDDALLDFVRTRVCVGGVDKDVLTSGEGPAVIVLSEMPGISPQVARFARVVRDAGFAVWLPSLFGRDGAWPEAEAGLAVLRRACVSAEFGAMARGLPTPITDWLRGLARHAHVHCGGPGVGAVGMCFTGDFALAMMLEPAMRAPVLCQPSLPFGDPAAVQSSDETLAQIRTRLDAEDLTVEAFRFEGDRHCTAARFATYARALGPRFRPTVLPDACASASPPPFFAEVVGGPHSVVTAHLVDAAGEPTVAARDAIVDFLRHRLSPRSTP